ncbi:hypothetical protein TYRP_020961 [Tyrophagus putrescentiae]|nr:hypothetical protein TYRP_020961 [Tyrophagus putrescentiae]
MSNRKVTFTPLAPTPVGPYSQAVVATGATLYVSGQIGLNPVSRTLVSATDAAEQAVQAFTNFKAVVEASGGDAGRRRQGQHLPRQHGRLCRRQRGDEELLRDALSGEEYGGRGRSSLGALVELEGIVQLPAGATPKL